MFTVKTYNHFESSLSNAKTVVGLEWLYEEVRNHLGKILALLLVLLIGLPLVFFFGYWLQRKRKKLVRHMKREMPSFKNSDNYLKFKRYEKNLDELMPSLKRVSEYNIKKAPWLLRYTLRQMQKMSSTVATYNSWMKQRLSPLNEQQFANNFKVFTFISEKELWKNRNNVYKYWM